MTGLLAFAGGVVVGVVYHAYLNEPVKRLLAWFKSLAVHPKE